MKGIVKLEQEAGSTGAYVRLPCVGRVTGLQLVDVAGDSPFEGGGEAAPPHGDA